MSSPSAASSTFDEIPHPGQPVEKSHPDRLAAIAMLFGMRPKAVDRCRVLELGCATGVNLIPMAERHPHSTFLGIDDSPGQIAAGSRLVDAVGLENLELRQAEISEWGEDLGSFDYIIAHAVFSRVSKPVQDQILKLCRGLLHEQGVAYLSYNTYPGCSAQAIIRELLSRYAPPGVDARQRLARSRALLQFFSNALVHEPTPYRKLLKNTIDGILEQPDHYLYHEHLENENHPLYFHEFAARAADCGLQYLGEAVPATMFAANFGRDTEARLIRMANDVISLEQHFDLLRNRSFRQTLLCQGEVSLTRQLTPQSLDGLYVAGQLRAKNADLDLNGSALESFVAARGVTVSSPVPVVKAALYHLGSVWPRAASIDELLAGAAGLLGSANQEVSFSAEQREGLGHNIVQCIATGLVEPHSAPDRFVTAISPRPRATRLARTQSLVSRTVHNRRHQSVELDDPTQYILRYLDGEHDDEALLRELLAAVERADVSILVGGMPATGGEAVLQALRDTLNDSLARLAANALLEA